MAYPKALAYPFHKYKGVARTGRRIRFVAGVREKEKGAGKLRGKNGPAQNKECICLRKDSLLARWC